MVSKSFGCQSIDLMPIVRPTCSRNFRFHTRICRYLTLGNDDTFQQEWQIENNRGQTTFFVEVRNISQKMVCQKPWSVPYSQLKFWIDKTFWNLLLRKWYNQPVNGITHREGSRMSKSEDKKKATKKKPQKTAKEKKLAKREKKNK